MSAESPATGRAGLPPGGSSGQVLRTLSRHRAGARARARGVLPLLGVPRMACAHAPWPLPAARRSARSRTRCVYLLGCGDVYGERGYRRKGRLLSHAEAPPLLLLSNARAGSAQREAVDAALSVLRGGANVLEA